MLARWLRQLFGMRRLHSAKYSRRYSRPRARPTLDILEDRTAPANLSIVNAYLVDTAGASTAVVVTGAQVFTRLDWTSTDLTASDQYVVRFNVDGVILDSDVITSPTNGSYSWFLGGWYATAGTHNVTITLDATNGVPETNETAADNVRQFTFTPISPLGAGGNLPSLLESPIGGIRGQDWTIVNYNDTDPRVGQRSDYMGGGYQYDQHNGHDYTVGTFARMDAGVPVYATMAGTVEVVQDGNFDRETSSNSNPTNFVRIDHGSNWKTEYVHLMSNSIAVSPGQAVSAGQLIGLVGSSGNSTDAHLHFNTTWRSRLVEPNLEPLLYFSDPLQYQASVPSSVLEMGISNYDPLNDLKEGPAPTKIFATSTNWDAWVWYTLSHLDNGDAVRVRWYLPNGTLFTTYSYNATSSENYVRHRWSLNKASWSVAPGAWNVAVEVNGVEVARRAFEVTSGAGVSSLRVRQSGTYIIDERTTPIDFGSAAVAGGAPQLAFTVENQGSVPLTLTNLNLPPGFSLTSAFPNSVNAGSSTTFTIQLDTARAGAKFGQIRFDTNDPDTPTFNFNVSGTITGSAPAGAPSITLAAGAAAYMGGAAPAAIDAQAVFADSDSANFNTGSLTVAFAGGGTSADRLAIRNQGTAGGQIGVSGNTVTFSGTSIGNFTGGTGTTPLVITFNASSSVAAVQALIRNITFANVAQVVTTAPRYVRFTVTDETGKVSNDAVNVVILGNPRGTPSATWLSEGPGPSLNGQSENVPGSNPVVGAVHTVAAHPSNANILYLGGANGGLWKTHNALSSSPSWTPMTDPFPSNSIGVLEFDPMTGNQQTLIAGVGRFSSFGREGGSRAGLAITTNGGASWTQITGGVALNGKNISGAALRGSTIVVAVNVADNFVFGNIGIFRSTDGGTSFTQRSGAGGSGLAQGASFDLAADPTDPSVLYTSAVYASGAGIYKSTDTGLTWTKVSNAAMDALIDNGVNGTGTSNIEISVGRQNNVYVGIMNGGALAGLFRSGNGGSTWTQMDSPKTNENGTDVGLNPSGGKGPGPGSPPEQIAGGQGTIHFSLLADPNDANIVYAGGDRQPRSNGDTGGFPNSIGANDFSGRLFRGNAAAAPGSQWVHLTHRNNLPVGTSGGTASSSSPHADSRDMTFDAAGRLIEGDDGGIYVRTSPQNNTGDWFSLAGDLRITEIHDIAYDSLSNLLVAGTQDNGTTFQTTSGDATWSNISGGDGGDVAVDNITLAGSSQSIRYSSSQNLGNFRRRVYNASGGIVSTSAPALTVLAGGPALTPNFVTPVELNRVNPSRIIFGAENRIYESFDQGSTITALNTTGGLTGVTGFLQNAMIYGHSTNADLIVAGMGSSVGLRTTAGGTINPMPALPSAGGNDIADVVVGAGVNDIWVIDTNQVFRWNGTTWSNVTSNLTSIGGSDFRSIEYLPTRTGNLILVGTDTGVYATNASSVSWFKYNANLPNVPVWELVYNQTDDLLIAGTLGRGAWVVPNAAAADFGDAPDSYGTLFATDGPRHAASGPVLGAGRDVEFNAPSGILNGGGDDVTGNFDDDGVALGSLSLGLAGTLTVTVSTRPGKLDAWIDYNQNGVFNDPSERITAAGGTNVSLGVNVLNITVPAGATPGATYARFRLSIAGGLSPTGAASDGEVEDYAVIIGGAADTTPPTVTAQSPTPGSTISSSSASVDITFSEAVTGSDASDMVLTGTAGGTVGTPTNIGGNVWRFPITGLANGSLNISLAPDANDIEDLAGNDLSPSPTNWSYTVLIDATAPTVTARTPASGSSILTSNVNVDVTFSETVFGVDASDMVLTGAASLGATVGTPTDQGGNVWRFPISGLTTGVLNISLAPDIDDIEDAGGNDLNPRPTTWSYNADPIAPTVTAQSPSAGSVIGPGSVNVDVTFSEAVVGVDATDMVLSGTAGGTVGAPTNIGGNVWRFPISGLSLGTLNIGLAPDANDIEDSLGNDLNPSPTTWSYTVADITAPTVISQSPAVGATIATNNVNIDITFSETVTGVDSTDMILTGAAAAGATIGAPTDQGSNVWRFPITLVTNGTLNISLAPDGNDIEDLSGNDLTPRPTTWSYAVAIDTTRPSAPNIIGLSVDSGDSNSDRLTNDTTPTFTWSASTDAGGSGLAGYWWAVDNSTPEAGGTFTAAFSATPTISADGAHVFYVRAVDNNGNLSNPVSALPFFVDATAPTVTGITPVDGSTLTAGPTQIVVDFSETMDQISASNLLPSHLTLGGAGVGSANVTGASWTDSNTARFTITGAWGQGGVTVQLTGGSPRDRAGNALAAFTTGDFFIDSIGPTAPTLIGVTDDAGQSNSDGLTNDTTPTFSWNAATDTGTGVAGYFWAIDDSTPESGGAFTASLSAAPNVTANTPHTFYVRAQDVIGNLGPVGQFNFNIDTVTPTVTSTTPADGSTVTSGPTEIVVNFSEAMDRTSASNLLPGDLTLGGVGLGSATVTGASWIDADTARFTITGAWSLGQVTVQLTSGSPRDQAGNALQSYTTGDFTIIDADAPSAPSVTGLTDDTGDSNSDRLTNDPTPTFTWSASTDTGGSGVAGYWWAVNDFTPETGGTFVNALNAMIPGIGLGSHLFVVRAQDAAGNLGPVGTLPFTIDTFAPSVTGTTPFDGAIVTSGPSSILVDFSEAMGQLAGNLLPAHLTLGGPGLGSATVTGASWVDANTAAFAISGVWSLGLVTVQLAGGLPVDLAGNALTNYTTGDFTIIDGNAPSAPVIAGLTDDAGESSSDEITNDPTPTFTWAASTDTGGSGLTGYFWSIDDTTPETGGTFTTSLNASSPALTEGAHTFYVRAIDGAGNRGNLSVLPFIIDTTAPTVTSTTPGDGDVVAAGPNEILIAFSERMETSNLAGVLTLGGPGLGTATVTGMSWLGNTTARFTMGGAWGIGLVTVQVTADSLRDTAGNILVDYTVGDFTIPTPRPGNTSLTSPNGSGTDDTPTFNWNAASHATSYDLHVIHAPSGAQMILQTVTGTTFTPTTSLFTGDYLAWVRGRGPGGIGDWSPAAAFSVIVPPVNHPPQLQPIGNQAVLQTDASKIVAISAFDPNNDPLTPTTQIRTVSKVAFDLDQQLGLVMNTSYYTNVRGVNEKYIFSTVEGRWYFIVPDGRSFQGAELRKFNPAFNTVPFNPSDHLLAGRLSIDYYNNPALLHEATNPGAQPNISAIFAGSPPNTLTLSGYSAFLGIVEVRVTVTEPLGGSATQSFLFEIHNRTATSIEPIANRTVPHHAGVFNVGFVAGIPNGDILTQLPPTIVTVAKVAFDLDQQLQLTQSGGTYYTNVRGGGEKYIYSSAQNAWYFLIQDPNDPNAAELRKWSLSLSNSPVVARLGIAYLNNPALLHEAGAPPPEPLFPAASLTGTHPNFNISQSFPTSFAGDIQVTARVTNGTAVGTQIFLVHIINSAPVITPSGNANGNFSIAGGTSLNIDVIDNDSEPALAVSAQASTLAALAFQLDQQFGFDFRDSYHQGVHGRNEKWIWSTVELRWFSIQPNGELRRATPGGPVFDQLVAVLDINFWNDPSLLWNAQTPGAVQNVGIVVTPLNATTRRITFTPHPNFRGRIYATITAFDGVVTTQKTFFIDVV